MKKKAFLMTAIILAAMTAVIIIGWNSIISAADDFEDRVCHYESIEIQPGDTLWEIASEYAGDFGVNIPTYIKQLKSVNSMKSDCIIAGSHLIVMHY